MSLSPSLRYYARQVRRRVREARLPKNSGYCVICEKSSVFVEHGEYLRNHYRCRYCDTIPRSRALVNALNTFAPDWKSRVLHESSPGGAMSDYLKEHCAEYSSSHFFADVPRGEYAHGHRSENLEALTFADASFDVFVTSDVFEHVARPANAFREIARVLKPGGLHIFTTPWYPAQEQTVQRARIRPDGTFEHLLEPVYHGNPLSSNGSLVTFDWGRDFPQFVWRESGLFTTIYLERDRAKGLDADFLEVFVSSRLDDGPNR